MQLLALGTQTRIYQVALRPIKILSVLFLLFSGGVAQAFLSSWENSAQSFMDSGGTFSCNSCHGDDQKESLTMSAPNSVAFDVTEIDLDLSGFGTPNPTEHWAYWQYQIIGGGGDIDRNVSNSSSATINFPVNERLFTN